ncbi:MAG: hypothetical protein ABIL09_26915 [Gemmatimonadota bacterium]
MPAVLILLPALLSCLLYWGAADLGWAFDDEDYIAAASRAQTDLGHLFSPDKPFAARPTVHLYFWVAYKLLGEDPRSYHVASVGLHCLNAVLLSFIVLRAAPGGLTASLAGALFVGAVNPYRAVYWVSGVSYLLAGTFALLCLLQIRSARSADPGLARWTSAAAYGLACGAHEAAALVVVLIAPWLWTGSVRRLLRDLSPYLLILCLLWLLSRFVYQTPLSGQSDFGLGSHLWSNLPDMLLGSFAGLGADTFEWSISSGTRRLLAAQVGLGLAAAAVMWPIYRPVVLWTLGVILPFSLWPTGPDTSRFYYLPVMGSAVIAAGAITWTAGRAAEVLRIAVVARCLPWALVGGVLVASYRERPCLEAVQYAYSGQYLQNTRRDLAAALRQYQEGLVRCGGRASVSVWLRNAAVCKLRLGRAAEAFGDLSGLVRATPGYDGIYDPLMEAYLQVSHVPFPEDPAGQQAALDGLRQEAGAATSGGRFLDARALSLLYLHYRPRDAAVRGWLDSASRGTGE